MGIGYDPDKPVYKDSLADKNFGALIAWDPINQKEAWSVKHATTWNAGVLTTDDLVFQGTAEGKADLGEYLKRAPGASDKAMIAMMAGG